MQSLTTSLLPKTNASKNTPSDSARPEKKGYNRLGRWNTATGLAYVCAIVNSTNDRRLYKRKPNR